MAVFFKLKSNNFHVFFFSPFAEIEEGDLYSPSSYMVKGKRRNENIGFAVTEHESEGIGSIGSTKMQIRSDNRMRSAGSAPRYRHIKLLMHTWCDYLMLSK